MTISTKNLSLSLGAAAASSLVFLVATPAQAATFSAVGSSFETSGITTTFLGNTCITATCVDLGGRYEDVDGGGVLFGDDLPVARTPGHDTGAEAKAQVTSFSATASGSNPSSGSLADERIQANNMDEEITVSGLGGAFEIYWGSVDSHNILEFFDGESLIGRITGSDIASNFAPGASRNAQGNFGFDAYVTFAGLFDRVVLSTLIQDGTTNLGNGISFEVATATAVPEPTAILSLLAVGAIAGGSALKRKGQDA